MIEDNSLEIVQEEPTSVEESVSPATTEVKETVVAPEPLTAEKVQEMIEAATIKAVAEAKELGKKELQSAQDRNKAELARARRRAEEAENTLGAARTHIQGIDPEIAKDVELLELRARERSRTTSEHEETTSRQQETQAKAIQDALAAHLETLGIDRKDERLDWADDATDYASGRARFDASVAKIILEEKKTTESSFEKRLKELEAKVAGDSTEANSVETTTPIGVVAGSDKDFVKKFANYELPATKGNVERYNKIVNKE